MIRRPDYGRGAAISGNSSATAQSPGFGAADVTCTSGFYNTFFGGDAALSQDCFQAVNATLQTRAQNRQDIVELNFEGAVAEWGAGELRLAAGYQGRDNSSTFVPDILQSTVSYTDQVVGVYPTGYMDASTSVDDLYLEALVPLLANRTGFQRLELELGGRWSDYEHADKEETYKALINWEINDWFRFRGGFNRATRAPNLGELFLATRRKSSRWAATTSAIRAACARRRLTARVVRARPGARAPRNAARASLRSDSRRCRRAPD